MLTLTDGAVKQIVGPGRGWPLSQLVWCGEGRTKSPRRVNSDVRTLFFPMMKSRLLTNLVTQLLFVLTVAGSPMKDDGWSAAVNGLKTRLTLSEGDSYYGTRRLVPYLELRNVREEGSQMEVNCDQHHLIVELVNSDGKPVRSGWIQPRSGMSPELNILALPWHSSMTLSLENNTWMIPRNAAAVVSTDSGAWVLEGAEKGKVFLRATLTDEPIKPYFWKRWYGKIQTPLLKVDWK